MWYWLAATYRDTLFILKESNKYLKKLAAFRTIFIWCEWYTVLIRYGTLLARCNAFLIRYASTFILNSFTVKFSCLCQIFFNVKICMIWTENTHKYLWNDSIIYVNKIWEQKIRNRGMCPGMNFFSLSIIFCFFYPEKIMKQDIKSKSWIL